MIFGEESFLLRRNKTEIIFDEGKYFFRGKQNRGRKMRNIFGDGKYFFAGEKINRGKGGKYLERKNMFFCGGDE